tara:strand:- start:162 stop:326 length:165 start_codon:yes stop_codon:yes gene_type:complete
MSDEISEQIGTAKGIDGAVKNCVNCGVEFYPALKSAEPIKCEACGKKFSVRIYE